MLNAPSEIASTAAPAQRSAPRQDRAAPTESFASLVDSNTADAASSQPAPTPDSRSASNADDRAFRPRRNDSTDQTSPRDRRDDSTAAQPVRTDTTKTDSTSTTKAASDSKATTGNDSKTADKTKAGDSKDTSDSKTADQSQSADTTAAAQPVVPVVVPTVAPPTPTGAAGVPIEGATDATASGGPLSIAAAAALKAQATIADATATGLPAETATTTPAPATATDVTTDPKLAAMLAAQPNAGKATDATAKTDPAATIKTPASTDAAPATPAPHAPAHADTAKPQDAQAKPADTTGAAVDQLADQPKPAATHQHHADAQTAPDPSALQPQVQTAQPIQASTLTQQTAAAPQLTAALATNVPVAVQDLAVTIAARANAGNSRFEIRLDPAELGRIDVRIEVDRHGQVTSHLTVEKPETLAMLRQDQTQLQRALDNAGLKTSDSGLQFSLRDQSSSGQQGQQQQDSGRHAQRLVIKDEDLSPAMTAGRSYGRMLSASGGVDIRI
ncbi:flagellar hook-length control protein FliK [Rhodopseudomonas sp.]|uniref:flagellar hook-length control protein FliK n=1 Tax=Rhodopseudomonas sp. TaxID=1078 RepID=UPI003B3B388B